MNPNVNPARVVDVNGAGAQRSHPNMGPNRNPFGFGPQGDVIRIFNFVRCVRCVRCIRGTSSPHPRTSNLSGRALSNAGTHKIALEGTDYPSTYSDSYSDGSSYGGTFTDTNDFQSYEGAD